MSNTVMGSWIQPFIRRSGSAIAVLAIAACSLTPTNIVTSTPASPAANLSTVTSPPVVSAVETAQGVRQTTLIEGLERPWSMAWLPDGTLLITEKTGRLRLVRDGVLEPTPIAGVPEVMSSGQGGLMEIAIHPRFAENRLVYLTYSHGTENANRTRLARATFDGKALRDLQVIFEVSQVKSGGQHFGSRIVWLPDGTMLVAIGDGGNPPVQLEGDLIRKQAQNLRSHLGKIVRLKDDGSIPRDNPFATRADANPAIWSYGHRNIQGLTFDPSTQRVWATEHGARGGDELNLVEAGKNYGWPIVTYSQEYSGGEISQERSRPGMVDPKVVWTPATAPSGLAIYSGDRFPDWQGDLFAGGLVSRDVRRINLDATGKVLGQQAIAIGQRVRDVRQGPDGLLYILTDESEDGRLIRLEPTGG
ncbi:PQQ-dependent sugar dehydrogenase [Leptodesmis sichuanensis]|uniref:PQQ-dependent sugar dehydrogenase n=1 Tax=Leptodesmis sichuanensis TaxID=2906798 RepID=UPI001F170E18|nr:PQQ-dependent sugar dehydrogenase [Leptodesmis sichuanensis]